jgi:predicted phosphate transport protein (TIGR00153 family)
MRLALVPRTSAFYDLFREAAENALRAAQQAERRFREFPSTEVSQADIKAIETRGDDITHDLIQLLNTQYVTPFDREDIFQLATAIDDVVDHIEEACNLLELYGVEQPARQSVEQCAIIVDSVAQLATAVSNLKGMRGVQDALVEVKRKEDEGDRLVREAIGALFHDARIDPLVVIRWKDIYEALEDALDACETAANVIGNIVVKNA